MFTNLNGLVELCVQVHYESMETCLCVQTNKAFNFECDLSTLPLYWFLRVMSQLSSRIITRMMANLSL